FVGGGIGYAAQNLAGLAFPLSFLKFSRGFEAEADYLGLEYMYKAGYDPQAFTAFFEKVKVLEKQRPGFVAKAFETHPQTPDRIQKPRRELNPLLPRGEKHGGQAEKSKNEKPKLGFLKNRHKINDGQQGRPTLRRRTVPADTDDKENQGDHEDHPTLKRRNN